MASSAEFKLGTPELVCRWRLASCTLPLQGRHIRALKERTLAGDALSPKLVAWAQQHIEGTLTAGAAEHPDGVLMLVIDTEGQAAMSVGPYQALEHIKTSELIERAKQSALEAQKSGVAPEVLWVQFEETLVCAKDSEEPPAAVQSLVQDLADTLGIKYCFDPELLSKVSIDSTDAQEAFLVSDEHGVVLASDKPGALGQRFLAGYNKLLETTQNKQ